MATLRQAIKARIDTLTQQIEAIKQNAVDAITPLQTKISAEQQKLTRFAPYLDQEVTVVQEKVNTLLDSYK